MSGYTLGDSPSVFLARFEGSTGTQAWLTHLGEETGMSHLAQSVAVVEGGQHGRVEGVAAGSDAGAAGAPAVEGEEVATGGDARIVVVGFNTSVASAGSHSSTGFTAAADTDGNWAWHSASQEADRQTAIAIGGGGLQGGSGESFAYIVGTVAASEASPGNYLFLDIQRVIREGTNTLAPAPAPAPETAAQQALSPDAAAYPDTAGGASSTTGLSQGSSLWLLIIAPIFVVLSCIVTVSYVSKQCAIAFGTRPPQREPIDSIEFGASGRDLRSTRSFGRGRGKGSSSHWNDGGSVSPSSADRQRRRNSGSGSGSVRSTKGRRSGAWPRSVAAAFRDSSDGPPYRKLGARERSYDARSGDGHGGRGRRGSSASSSPPSADNSEVELRQVTARHDVPFDSYPRGEGSPGGGGGGRQMSGGSGGDDGGGETLAGFEDMSPSNTSEAAAAGWDAFEDEGNLVGGEGGERGLPHVTGNPRDDEPPQLFS